MDENNIQGYIEGVFEESLNEGPIDRVIGGRPYEYIGDGRKGKAIVSGPMKDREKETIIKRAKEFKDRSLYLDPWSAGGKY